MKTPVVNGRPYYISIGTRSTFLMYVLQELIFLVKPVLHLDRHLVDKVHALMIWLISKNVV